MRSRIPDTSISGRRVARELTALIRDNGTEFTSTAILAWAQDHGVDWHYIALGKPVQNGFVERILQRADARRIAQ